MFHDCVRSDSSPARSAACVGRRAHDDRETPAVAATYTGRVYVMLSMRDQTPRRRPSWFDTEPFFAIEVADWKAETPLTIDDATLAFPTPLSRLAPAGTFWQSRAGAGQEWLSAQGDEPDGVGHSIIF